MQGDCLDNQLMGECEIFLRLDMLFRTDVTGTVYRVHWLKAKAINDRWREELTRVQYEMKWVRSYFEYQARIWERHAESSEQERKAGHKCYALRQRAMWENLSSHALETFQLVTKDVQ